VATAAQLIGGSGFWCIDWATSRAKDRASGRATFFDLSPVRLRILPRFEELLQPTSSPLVGRSWPTARRPPPVRRINPPNEKAETGEGSWWASTLRPSAQAAFSGADAAAPDRPGPAWESRPTRPRVSGRGDVAELRPLTRARAIGWPCPARRSSASLGRLGWCSENLCPPG